MNRPIYLDHNGGAHFARGAHIITGQVEHPAVLEVCHFMERHGFSVTCLPVDETGRVNPADVAAAPTPHTTMISIMHANLAGNMDHIQKMRDCLEEALQSGLQDIRFNGSLPNRLPNTSSVSFLDLEANRILEEAGLEVA
jgi:cysteine sulfinate desulfinase/cysteine desulfurase-like protein